MKTCAIITSWQGETAIKFSAGGYEALLIPGIGANLIKLRDNKRSLDLIRTPKSIYSFRAKPQVYGIPILFPPNRIEDGTFIFNNRKYQFPINETDKNNHIHGFLYNRPWEIVKLHSVNGRAEVELIFSSDKNSELFQYFPHEFEFNLNYVLTENGLEQIVCISNYSNTNMPLGLGFHTAFKIPFHSDSTEDDYLMRVSINERWQLNDRILPTGMLYSLSYKESKFRDEGVNPCYQPLSQHYTSHPMKYRGINFHGAIIEDRTKRVHLIYHVDKAFKHWTLWNDRGNDGFICPEPQTWAINAPNLDLPNKVTGLISLEPEKTWSQKCRIFVLDY